MCKFNSSCEIYDGDIVMVSKSEKNNEPSRVLGYLVAQDLSDLEVEMVSGGNGESAGGYDDTWSNDKSGNFTVQDDVSGKK